MYYDLFSPAHKEADTKIIYHSCNKNYSANTIIQYSDTDIFVILDYKFKLKQFQNQDKV